MQSFRRQRFATISQNSVNFCEVPHVLHGWRKIAKSSLVQPLRSKRRKESAFTKRSSCIPEHIYQQQKSFGIQVLVYLMPIFTKGAL